MIRLILLEEVWTYSQYIINYQIIYRFCNALLVFWWYNELQLKQQYNKLYLQACANTHMCLIITT